MLDGPWLRDPFLTFPSLNVSTNVACIYEHFTTSLHLILRMRMIGAVHPLYHLPSWYAEGELYLYLYVAVMSFCTTVSVHLFLANLLVWELLACALLCLTVHWHTWTPLAATWLICLCSCSKMPLMSMHMQLNLLEWSGSWPTPSMVWLWVSLLLEMHSVAVVTKCENSEFISPTSFPLFVSLLRHFYCYVHFLMMNLIYLAFRSSFQISCLLRPFFRTIFF